jgi:hypothetical protein
VQLESNPGTTQSTPSHLAEDRRKAHRRQRPTRPWSGLFGPLRRAHGRRLTDRAHYVDVYSRKDAFLVLVIFMLNVGDAFMTMMWLSRGGREANPIMDFFLDIGPGAFIAQKCFIVGFWLLVLLMHKNFRFARIGLYAALMVYALLMILHFGIIALGITPAPSKLDTAAHHKSIIIRDAAERADLAPHVSDE